MNRTTARILGGALLIALVAAGTPLAQTLRIARTAATAEKRAETRLLLPGEWSTAQGVSGGEQTAQEKQAPLAPQLLKPISEQWDTARALQAPPADLPAVPELPVCADVLVRISSELGFWLPQTDPPERRSRGPPELG